MEKILFLIHTEYHLFLCISIIKKHFINAESEITIIQTETGSRFKFEVNVDDFNINYKKLKLSYTDFKFSSTVKREVNQVIKKDLTQYFFFLDQNVINRHILTKLDKNTTINAVQDGLGAYAIVPKTFKNQFKYFFKYSLFTISKRLNYSYPFLRHFEKNNKLKYIWLTNPEIWNKKTPAVIKRIEFNENVNQMIKKVFSFNEPLLKNELIYFNQPIDDIVIKKFEFEFLKNIAQILNKFNKQILIKLHPHTSKTDIEKFKEIDSIKFIKAGVPSEVWMLNTQNSIFISLWSSSLLFELKGCNYFWVYKTLKNSKINYMLKKTFEQKSLNHIKFIEEESELYDFINSFYSINS